MTLRPILATLIFASLFLSATAAAACPWTDASAQGDPTKVASTMPSQDGTTTPPPSSPN